MPLVMCWAWAPWWLLLSQAVPWDDMWKAGSVAEASAGEAFASEVLSALNVWVACFVVCCVQTAGIELLCTVSFHVGAVSAAAEASELEFVFVRGMGRSEVTRLLNWMWRRRSYLAAKTSSQACTSV